MKGISLYIALVVIFSWHCTSFAKPAEDKPKFKEKQIVVHGSPVDFPGHEVVKYLPNADLTILEVPRGSEKKQVRTMLASGYQAGLNYLLYAFASVNDPYFSPYQSNLRSVQSESAWDLTAGEGVTIAVLDTGLAVGGTDGIGCVHMGYDIVNNDNDPADVSGHGTHVAGTIAQKSDNETGCAGMSYAACVMPVKVLDDTGSGTSADIADGIYWAVNNGSKVINMSLGFNAEYGITNDPVIDPALDYAYNNNVTVVVSSGNDASGDNVSYPAIYPTCIAVGATDYLNEVTGYSNKGIGLDLVAPGGDLSADKNGDGYPDGILQETFNSGSWEYSFYEGTSMAAPHVSAAAAMLIAYGTASTP
ncbi:MAG: serine proteinase, partial [Candidatus Electrothrix sp. AR4]|nr:serine proteinase [Candidatus Electrothrix sp. AR4]